MYVTNRNFKKRSKNDLQSIEGAKKYKLLNPGLYYVKTLLVTKRSLRFTILNKIALLSLVLQFFLSLILDALCYDDE